MADIKIGVITFPIELGNTDPYKGLFDHIAYYNKNGKWADLPVEVPDPEPNGGPHVTTTSVWLRTGPTVSAATQIVVMPKGTLVKLLYSDSAGDGPFVPVELSQDVGAVKAGSRGWVSFAFLAKVQ